MSAIDLEEAYETRALLCRQLGPIMKTLIEQLLTAAEVRFHSVDHRLKGVQSFRRKISRQGSSYTSIDQIHHLLGLRVITYFPDEVDAAEAVIQEEFRIDWENSVDKRVLLDPDRFGYLSLHFVASLGAAREDLTEYRQFAGICFEVEIRSILQHAWAEIEHDLGYETAAAVPSAIRRRFSRLAGLLEIADTEFQSLRDDVGHYQEAVIAEVTAPAPDLRVDRDTVAAYARASEVVREIDEFIMTQSACASVEPITDTYAGSLAKEFSLLEVTSVAQIDEYMKRYADVIKRFCVLWHPELRMTVVTEGTSLFYLTWVLAGASQDLEKIRDYVAEMDFSGDAAQTAEDVLKTYNEAIRDDSGGSGQAAEESARDE